MSTQLFRDRECDGVISSKIPFDITFAIILLNLKTTGTCWLSYNKERSPISGFYLTVFD